MSSHASFRIPADLEEIPKVSEELERCMRQEGIGDETILDVELAVEEAVTNSILHGYDGKEGMVEITIDAEPARVSVEIADNAPAFNPLSIPEPDTSADLEDRQIGGLGVFLIRRVMDEVTYRREGERNVLLMVKEKT